MSEHMHETDPTRRFSNRVEHYLRYRPGYPAELVAYFTNTLGLRDSDTVADVGSGTGLLTRLLLDNGNRVYGVEPNREMRHAAERILRARGRFVSIDGSAEATTLTDASVDAVVAAQAFHWFDHDAARREFARILRPGGWAAALWNVRDTNACPFMQEYERLMVEHGVDYERINHRRVDAAELARFFGRYDQWRCSFEEWLDFDASIGRMLSASYVPAPGQEGHEAIVRGFREVFDRCQENGGARWVFTTEVYSGRLG
jgi:SAM-dependent methyltransferase